MVKVGRDTATYKYLRFAFDVFAKFRNKGASWHQHEGLENSDFCRIVRVAMIYAPTILAVHFIVMPYMLWKLALEPVVMSLNPLGTLEPFFWGLGVAAVIGAVITAIAVIHHQHERISEAYFAKHGHYPTTAHKPKKQNTFKQFSSAVYVSIKERFCPIITFEK